MSLTMVNVTGQYLDGFSKPQSGYVRFIPSTRYLVDNSNNVIYTLDVVEAILDSTGSVNFKVPSTTQAGASGTFEYTVAVDIQGQGGDNFVISADTDVNLRLVTPISSAPIPGDSLASEITRATSAENNLQSQINSITSGGTGGAKADENVFYPETYGAAADGTTDDTTAVVNCIAAAVAAGGIAMFLKQYRITSQLVLQANTWLHLKFASTHIIGDFSGPQLITSAGYSTATKQNDIRITGPGKIGRKTTAQTGDIFRIWGDRFVCMQVEINTYGGGRAFYGGGDRHLCFGNKAMVNDGQIGSGGWRYMGGSYSKFIGMHIESGDDCLQFVPSAQQTDPLFNQSISHCWYEHCTGISASARFMAVVLTSTSNPGQMTCSITHSGFRDCHGTGNQRGINVTNRDSSGSIEDITFSGCSVDMSGGNTTFAEDVLVKQDTSTAASFPGGTSVGPVRNIRFDGFSITNSVAQTAQIRVEGACENVALDDLRLTMVASAAECLIEISGPITVKVGRGRLDMSGIALPCILVGAGGTATTDVQVDGTRFVNVAALQYAVNFNACATPQMRHTRVEPASGVSTAKSWRTGTTTTNARIRDNDFSLLTGTHWSDTGTGTQHSGNAGMSD